MVRLRYEADCHLPIVLPNLHLQAFEALGIEGDVDGMRATFLFEDIDLVADLRGQLFHLLGRARGWLRDFSRIWNTARQRRTRNRGVDGGEVPGSRIGVGSRAFRGRISNVCFAALRLGLVLVVL